MEPTKERWFWEQCGLKIVPLAFEHLWWVDADGNRVYPAYEGNPPIDLNNLFKYAVPRVNYQVILKNIRGGWHCMLFNSQKEEPRIESFNEDPALALFKAIYKALGGK